jgi:hypothetical protein
MSEKVVAKGSFASSKENLRREGINFEYSKRLIKRLKKLIKKGK